jgi:hypothetical protein
VDVQSKKEERIAMRLLKQAVTMLGAVMIVAVLVAVVAPKRVQAVVATLVQIVPGTTTHLGQNESQLVSLVCYGGFSFCAEESPTTGGECCAGLTVYVVPAGYTLIVTDYSWASNAGYAPPGTYFCDQLAAAQPSASTRRYPSSQNCGLADSTGVVAHDSHFTTGVRFASGSTLYDNLSFSEGGAAYLQGYLVPN